MDLSVRPTEYSMVQVNTLYYVVRELQKALLGRPAIESLGLLIRVDEVLSSKSVDVSKFPHIFTGLGWMKGAYHIEMLLHLLLQYPQSSYTSHGESQN